MPSKVNNMSDLDWFALETRMRQTMLQILEPINEAQAAQKGELMQLQMSNRGLTEKLVEVELMLGLGDHPSGWMGRTNARLQGVREELNAFAVKVAEQDQQWAAMHSSKDQAIAGLRARAESTQKQLTSTSQSLNEVLSVLTTNKEAIESHMNGLKLDIRRAYEQLSSETNILQSTTHTAIKSSSEAQKCAQGVKAYVDKFNEMMGNVNKQILKLSEQKLNSADLHRFQRETTLQFEQQSLRIGQSEAAHQQLLRYLDVYMPIELNSLLADHMLSFINYEQLSLWAKFQEEKRKKLQSKAVKCKIEYKLINLMKRAVESSHENELKMDKIDREVVKNKIEARLMMPQIEKLEEIDVRKGTEESAESLAAQTEPSAKETSSEQPQKVEMDDDRAKVRLEELEQQVSKLCSRTQQELEEIKEYVRLVVEDAQAAGRMRREDRAVFDLQLLELTRRVDKVDVGEGEVEEKIRNVGDLGACLAEFMLAVQAVMVHEGEEQGRLLPSLKCKKVDSPRARTRGSVSCKKKMHGRGELVETMVAALQRCWNKVSQKPPFKERRKKNN